LENGENLQPLEEQHVTENIVNLMPENLLLLSKESITEHLVFETNQSSRSQRG
jgi:hypothetical protein